MAIQWLAADLGTGEIRAELPDLSFSSLRHRIGNYDTTTATLPVVGRPAPPSNWLRATRPGSSMLVALNDASMPVWAGYIGQRQRAGGGNAATFSLTTLEGYTARRFIRDTRQYPATDRLVIARDLLTRYVLDPAVGGTSGRPGIPLRLAVSGSGAPVDGDYKDADDRTIYSVLQDLGGEWTFGLEWQTGPTRITPWCALSERVGQPALAAGPAITFDWPGNLTTAEILEDFSENSGGNDIMATSSGQGEVRPQSAHVVANDFQGRPTFEIRQNVGSNIVSLPTLNSYASQILAASKNGKVAYTITVSQSSPQAFAAAMGDDVGINLSGPLFAENPRAVVRLAGTQIDKTTVTPILVGADDGE